MHMLQETDSPNAQFKAQTGSTELHG